MPRENAAGLFQSLPNKAIADGAPKLGTIERIDDSGEVFVNFAGYPECPVKAAVAVHLVADIDSPQVLLESKVLLVFEDNDVRYPVIVGLVADSINEARRSAEDARNLLAELIVDGRSLKISAQDEISLACGKSRITLRKDGKIVLRGTDVISRASASNRIRGARVKIN